MKNNAWAVWGPVRLGGPGPLDKTALHISPPSTEMPRHTEKVLTDRRKTRLGSTLVVGSTQSL